MRVQQVIALLLTIIMGLGFTLTSKAETPASRPVAKKKKSVKAIVRTKVKSNKATVVAKADPVTAPLSTPAAGELTKNSAALESVPTPEGAQKPWSVALSAEYYPQTSNNVDAFIFWVVNPFYTFAKYHTFSITQRAIQTTIPEPGKEAQFNVLNTRLDYTYSFTEPDTKDISVSIRFRSELGNSADSHANGLNSINSVRLNFKKPIGDFYFGLRPYVAYYSTQYAIDAAGLPLPFLAVGHNLALGYNFTKKFSWALEADTAFKLYQPGEVAQAVQRQQQAAIPGIAQVSTDTSSSAMYLFTEVAYQATSSIAVRLGYWQDDKMVTDGKYAINFLDQSTTRVYLGLDYTF